MQGLERYGGQIMKEKERENRKIERKKGRQKIYMNL